ncbi:DUF397 domain-containing protein [Streptomyces sp. NPDC001970]
MRIIDGHDLSNASWRKSTYSNANGAECLEVADHLPHTVPVRDSKNPAGPVLLFPAPAWAAFIAHLHRHETA